MVRTKLGGALVVRNGGKELQIVIQPYRRHSRSAVEGWHLIRHQGVLIRSFSRIFSPPADACKTPESNPMRLNPTLAYSNGNAVVDQFSRIESLPH